MTKVLGIGNALVDIITLLDSDETLRQFNLPKGSMQLVDAVFSDKINQGTGHLRKTLASGGSAANTIHGLARMGIGTGFIGKVGKDQMGQFFAEDLLKSGITPHLLQSDSPTGLSIALISPDSERTFATFLGAAIELSAGNLTDEIYKGYQYFHIEGYLVQNHELIEKAVKHARRNGLKVSLDMASYNVVEENLDILRNIVSNDVDIVFANEEEARSFTGKEPHEAIRVFGDLCEIAVVKTGKEGSLIMKDGHLTRVEAIPANVKDTTGAGDLYASGFLAGLIRGYSLEKCGATGSILAGKTIEILGPKMDTVQWSEARRRISEL